MTANFSAYRLGRTASFACVADQRFSYCLHVPPGYARHASPARVLVAMHDSLRNNQALRDLFSEYAERTNTIVVAPLFPAGIVVADELDNYKYLEFSGIRFDKLAIAMVEEVAAYYGVDGSRFALFGFSGGAHFAHRFLYVHPERLTAVVAGAPGAVTLPTEDYAWWPGLANVSALFGKSVQWDRVLAVPLHLVIGAEDLNTRGIVTSKEHPRWVEGADAAGANRVERLRTLHARFQALKADVTFEALDGVGHQLGPIVEAAIRFFEKRLPARR